MPPKIPNPRPGTPARASSTTREALRQRGPTRRQVSRHEREVRHRRWLYSGAAALAVVVALVIGFGLLRENVLRANEPVAVIFGDRITTGELVERVKPQLSQLDRRAALFRANGMGQQALQIQFQRQQVPDQVLSNLIEDRIVRREAANRGVMVTRDEVDARLRELVAESDAANQPRPTSTPAAAAAAGASPSPSPTAGGPTGVPTPTAIPPTATPVATLTEERYGPGLSEYLTTLGYTEAQLRNEIEAELYEQKLREAMGQEVPAVQEQVQARHLVYKTQEEADAAYQKLQAGTSFDDLVAAQPDTGTGAKSDVNLGWLPKMGRDPIFDDALFGLQPAQVGQVIQTLNGFEILQAVARDPARPVEADKLDELRKRKYGDWLALAEGSPEIDRQLTPDRRTWVVDHASARKS